MTDWEVLESIRKSGIFGLYNILGSFAKFWEVRKFWEVLACTIDSKYWKVLGRREVLAGITGKLGSREVF